MVDSALGFANFPTRYPNRSWRLAGDRLSGTLCSTTLHTATRTSSCRLGYRGDLIRRFFLDYCPYVSTDFVMSEGGAVVEPSKSDIHDWRITFVDTGMHSNLGDRLLAVRDYLSGEEYFLANYSDQLSDLPLNQHIADVQSHNAIAGFVSVRPQQSYHNVETDESGYVTTLRSASETDYWINGGFFVLHRDFFDNIRPGEELVEAPFTRIAEQRRLWTQRYSGFWRAMDTFKDQNHVRSPGWEGQSSMGGFAAESILMLGLRLSQVSAPKILCLGAHCDDIEIGCGGTLLKLAESYPGALVTCVVFSANKQREAETRSALSTLCSGFSSLAVKVYGFRNAYFPSQFAEIKDEFEQLKADCEPDLVFTHFSRRSAPGPSVDIQPDVEYVPGSPGTRVRDPKVRRRCRQAKFVRCAFQRTGRQEGRLCARRISVTTRSSVVPAGDIRCAASSARCGVQRTIRMC